MSDRYRVSLQSFNESTKRLKSWNVFTTATTNLFLTLTVLLLCLIPLSSAQQVQVDKTGFDNLPEKMVYFKDSDVVLWLDGAAHSLYRSENHGKDWEKISDMDGQAHFLYEHPYDNEKAYILGKETKHWKTEDKGKTWLSFESPVEPATSSQHLSFHSQRSGYILFTGFQCNTKGWKSSDCRAETYYTVNNFKEIKLLRTHTTLCIWSISSAEFTNAPADEIMCVESPYKSGDIGLLDPKELRLVQTEDFFHTEQPVDFNTGIKVSGVVAVSAINQFLVAAVKPSSTQSDMDLYISLDGESWHEAVFPPGADIHEQAYTIVESSSSSLLVDMLGSKSGSYGTLYKSNSNGTYFIKSLEYTNRNNMGIIDFERIQGVEGVMIANVVINPADIHSGSTNKKKLQTRMSFDDGSTWSSIKNVVDTQGQKMKCSSQHQDECTLQLHSVTSPHNVGPVFSSFTAIGVVMGVGNYGDSLLDYDECDTFLSTDGGLNWKMVREGAHKYEFGDMGALLVMIDDEKETDHLWWSKDRGYSWEKLDLGLSVRARSLSTDPESTSRNFILIAGTGRGSDHSRVQSIHIDFTNIHQRQCKLDHNNDNNSDFERWDARDLTDGPDCLMGHEQLFYRRKADRDCYVGRDYQEPDVEIKNCPCSQADYECDFNFRRDIHSGKCVRERNDQLDNGECKSKSDTYLASSGYRLIPGNTCVVSNDKEALDAPIQRKCSDNDHEYFGGGNDNQDGSHTEMAPSEEGIRSFKTTFDDETEQFSYFTNSPSVLMRLHNGELWYSKEHGMKWTQVLKDQGRIQSYVMHEFDNQRAYALFENGMFATTDQGENWNEIRIPGLPSRHVSQILDFHPKYNDWLLILLDDPTSHQSNAYFSDNHGGSWRSFNLHVEKCIFGRDSNFIIRDETVYCSVYESQQSEKLQLIRTVDWGNSKQILYDHLIQFFVIEDFMAVAANIKGELNVFVSVDGDNFAEAQFPPHQYIDRDTFTVLQSTTHSILMNIFKSNTQGKAHGALYKSNENGTFYHLSLDNTNGNAMGYVDFEKMQGIDGIILANQVINADELIGGGPDVKKRVRTMISWDDGGQWQPLAPPNKFDCSGKECTLNLHSRTDIRGPGAIFTAGGVPGLAMGVGNVGPTLLPYDQSDTFLTTDAGHSWIRIQTGEHLYEFGDQGSLLVLINDEGPTNELLYSWDQGRKWHTYTFAEEPIRVSTLTTDPQSTTLRFVIIGHTRSSQRSPVVIVVDFSETDVRQCEHDNNEEKSDFEKWIAKDDDGDDACLLGKKIAYWRRKSDRVCKVGNRFKEPELIDTKCECRDIDFECDFGFWRNEKGECENSDRHPDRPTVCKPGDKFRGRSGYKKNSKSTCYGGVDLTQEKEWPCGESGQVHVTKTEFSDKVVDYLYFTDTNRVFVRTADNKVWRSDNDGYEWKQILEGNQIIAMYQNPHHEQNAYFITNSRILFLTEDRGSNIIERATPLPPIQNLVGTILNFHRDESDYLLFIGEDRCDSLISNECHSEAYYSHNNGQSWRSIGTYIRGCIWGRDGAIEHADHDTILCEIYREKTGNQRNFFANPLQFVSSDNYFESMQYLFEDMVGVAIFGKFMVVAVSQHGGANLQLHVSMDGKTFAPAQFPESFTVSPEAFTIMESSNNMWIHVSTNTHKGSEYGNIFTSNSNGTYFVLSLNNANRNEMGIVDFEKMQGIEGIALSNQVSNSNQANMGDPKKLVTRMTVDAGRSWIPLTPPNMDSKKEYFSCKEDCALHLHSYSERRNTRDLFSSSSAVGLMVGVGNVGSHLTPYRDGDMFLTRDAGKTWNEVYKGAHIWEFADQGGLLILVDDEEETNELKYTTNEGLTWNVFEFTKKKDRIKVDDIITQPDGTSQQYVIFGSERGGRNTVAYHIDFSSIHPTQCKLDINNEDDDDFELWSPVDVRGEKCLFGRETKYYRRIQDRNCYIGEKIIQPKEIVKNCTCTNEDYECDFNFVRNERNECVLVTGFSPVVPECDGNTDFIYYPTGYRKIAASTCQGGRELEKGDMLRCPGRGGSHWAIYIFAPLFGAAVIFGCLRYRSAFRYGRFGTIRLPDAGSGSSGDFLSHPIVGKVVSAIIIVPVVLVGLLSKISLPRSLSDLNIFNGIQLPSFLQFRNGPRYSALDQDDTDVLLDDYDATDSEGDADEL